MIEHLQSRLAALSPAARLAAFREAVPGRLVFTTSLGLEDQVLTHWIATQNLDIEIATLDTGRLFSETYTVWAETEERYGIRIKAMIPERPALEALVITQGPNGFYASIEARKACCHIRKIEPLNRLLSNASGWIAGLRADQSQARGDATLLSQDTARGLLKLNPLLDWNRDQVLAFAQASNVPLNALHARGFASIGCAPCTRALAPGESERAGRWWWESEAATSKECGLHVGPDGRLVRIASPESVAS
ncbi:MAG: phosphoadenylyl-sulfate reductase [Beijerinckiaceae bacterium]